MNEAKRRRIIKRTRPGSPGPSNEEASTAIQSVEKNFERCGIIQRIILKNVLCHEHLDFDSFTPDINLLQGRNGSGKSSIVAAIIACLGGSGRATDRGNTLKNIIKHGKSSATIEIHLKNTRCMGYKYEEFGDKVIVERRIVQSGANSYKIKSSNGVTVSTKKEDLNRILNWFNFEVDNPVIFLSQERAKTFLSSTNPKELFKFYMSATGLKQFKEDLVSCMENIDNLNKILILKKETLTELRKEVKKWDAKVQAVRSLEDRRQKISLLRREKAWAEIREIENNFEKMNKNAALMTAKLEKLTAILEESTQKKNSLQQTKSHLDAKIVALAETVRNAEVRRKQSGEELLNVKQHYRSITAQNQYLAKEVLEKEKEIKLLQEKLEKDNTEAHDAWAKETARLENAKQSLQLDINELKSKYSTELVQYSNLSNTLKAEREVYNQLCMEEQAMKSRYNSVTRELHSLQNQKNPLAIFGQYIPRVVEEIEIAQSRNAFQDQVIGPMGRHIKIKSQEWGHIAEQVIGNLISGFQVSNQKDLQTLQGIFNRILHKGERTPTIIISRFRVTVHDFKRYETGTPQYPSLWSLLDVDNIHVANTLIDQLNIESILLVPTAQEAASLLTNQETELKIYTDDANKALAEFHMRKVEKQKQIKSLETESALSQQSQSKIKERLTIFYREIQLLQNEVIPPPLNVFQLQNDLEETERKKREAEEKINSNTLSLKQVQIEMDEKKGFHNASQEESEKIQNEFQNFQDELDKTSNSLVVIKKEIALYNRKLSECESSSQASAIKDLEKRLCEKKAAVTAIHPDRIATRRSIDDIQRDIEVLTEAVKKVEERHGSFEAIFSEWRKRKERYEAMVEEINTQTEFLNKVSASILPRQDLFKINKKLYALILNTNFGNYIINRKLFGCITVNYENGTMTILTKKSTGHNREENFQSLKMMSGGERSFATVSFIIALWDMTSSPVRIMDEFDIFMDVISKKNCMDLILSCVDANHQHILVSPQEYKIMDDRLTIFRKWSSAVGNPLSEERVLKSVAPKVNPPKGNLTEFLLKDVNKWRNLTALECAATGSRISYAELVDWSRRWSGFLTQKGIQKGDIITYISRNSPHFGPIFLGTVAIGAVISPINPNFTADEINKLLSSTHSKMLIVSEDVEPLVVDKVLERIGYEIPYRLCVGKSKKGLPNVLNILQDHSIQFVDSAELTGEEMVFLPFSSGTTGFPKATAISHNAFIANTFQFQNPHHQIIPYTAADGPQESFIAMLPFFHVYGAFIIFMIGLTNGFKIVTLPTFDPSLFISSIIDHKVGFLHTVPTLLNFLNSREECNSRDMGHIHTTICGAAPVPPSAAKIFCQKIEHNVEFLEGYGMTETLVTHATPRNSRRVGCAGQLLSNAEAKIVDPETGKALSSNQSGEIWLRTPSRMMYYFNNPNATAATITKDGWIKTGDIGFYDDEGYFSIVDRTKDLIKVKGLQVAPSELEEVLQSHPSVLESSVIGIPDDRLGEAPKAFVILKKAAKEKELLQFVESKLSKHKHLVGGIVFVNSLPKSDTGKVLKRELRKL